MCNLHARNFYAESEGSAHSTRPEWAPVDALGYDSGTRARLAHSGVVMDEGKRQYGSYLEAQRACQYLIKKKRAPFTVYGSNRVWYVGGVHMKQRDATKRLKSFEDIKQLFAEDLDEQLSEGQVDAYASDVVADSEAGMETIESGSEAECILREASLQTGRELGMNNSNAYLVIDVDVGDDRKQILMGGAFARHIPVVMKQAKRMKGKPIVWYTWNPSGGAKTWGHERWFYMIEERPA